MLCWSDWSDFLAVLQTKTMKVVDTKPGFSVFDEKPGHPARGGSVVTIEYQKIGGKASGLTLQARVSF